MAPKRSQKQAVTDHNARKRRRSPEEIAKMWITNKKDQKGFNITFINDVKGYGVFAAKEFQQGDFLLEYCGEQISEDMAEAREKKYARRHQNSRYPRCYMYYYRQSGKVSCIDATNTLGRAGHVVNDAETQQKQNSKMKKIVQDGVVHLALFATKCISIGSEILYDYGVDNLWWRKPQKPGSFDGNSNEEMAQDDADNEIKKDDDGKEMMTQDNDGKEEMTDGAKVTHTKDGKEVMTKDDDGKELIEGIEGKGITKDGMEMTDDDDGMEEKTQDDDTKEVTTEGDDVMDEKTQDDDTKDVTTEGDDVMEEKTQYDDTNEVTTEGDDVMEEKTQYDDTNEVTTEDDDVMEEETPDDDTNEVTTEGDDVMDEKTQDDDIKEVTTEGDDVMEEKTQYDDTNEVITEGDDVMEEKTQYDDTNEVTTEGDDVMEEKTQDDDKEMTKVNYCKRKLTNDDGKKKIAQYSDRKEMTKDKGFVCKFCGNRYRVELNLKTHIETCHRAKGHCLEDEDETTSEAEPDSDSLDPDFDPITGVGDSDVDDADMDRDVYDDDIDTDVYDADMEADIYDDDINTNRADANVEDSKERKQQTAFVSSTQNEKGKRTWDKRNACYYCQSVVTNIGRHLIRNHSTETEVAKALSFEKKSPKRNKHFDGLRHIGNFYHNAKVLTSGQGELLVAKRPPKGRQLFVSDYVPCVHCKGYFVTVEIWRHYNVCKWKNSEEDLADGTEHMVSGLKGSRILKETLVSNHKDNVLFLNMKKDSISMACKDNIIATLGRNMLQTKGEEHITYIRAKMRECARLLIEVRKLKKENEQLTLEKVITPQKFDEVIDGIQGVCKFTCEQRCSAHFEIPSLALKLGHTLKKCAFIKQGLCLRVKDKQGEEETESFLKLMEMEFTNKVSSIALNTLHRQQQKKAQVLPLTSDIIKVQSYLKDKVGTLSKTLQATEEYHATFQSLAKATLSRIICFNKRRSGEAGKILLTDFTERNKVSADGNQDVFQMLSPGEQKLSSRLDLMNTKGKRGRLVPVILTPEISKALDLLADIQYRKKAGISEHNKYLFPLSRGSLNCIRGCDALLEMIKECDLQLPESFRSTALRKYIATVSQVLAMDQNELDWLARHLGHDIRVHREYYRLQEQHLELAKVAKLLYAVDGGNIHMYAGKKLDEIHVGDLDEMEEHDSDEDDADIDIDVPVEDADLDTDDGGGDIDNADMNTKRSSLMLDVADSKQRKHQTGKQCQHRPWTGPQKVFLMKEFHLNIRDSSLVGVGKKKCEEVKMKAGKLLASRTWTQIKSCIKNIIVKEQKENVRIRRYQTSQESI